MSEPGYIEMRSGSPRTRDYARGVREGGCPECGHDSLVVMQALVATRIDPACWAGYCTCGEQNREYREGLAECPDCSLLVSDIHEPDSAEECDCECHCGCAAEFG